MAESWAFLFALFLLNLKERLSVERTVEDNVWSNFFGEWDLAITQKDCSARRESAGDIRNQEYTPAQICEIGLFFSGNKCEASYFFLIQVWGLVGVERVVWLKDTSQRDYSLKTSQWLK